MPPSTSKIGNERVLLIRVGGSIRLRWVNLGTIIIISCMLSFDPFLYFVSTRSDLWICIFLKKNNYKYPFFLCNILITYLITYQILVVFFFSNKTGLSLKFR